MYWATEQTAKQSHLIEDPTEFFYPRVLVHLYHFFYNETRSSYFYYRFTCCTPAVKLNFLQVNEDGLTVGDVGDILFASDSAAQPLALDTQLAANGQPLQRLASCQPVKLATCPPLPQLDDRDVVVEEEVVAPTVTCNIADNGSSNSINGSPSNSDHSIRSDSTWSSNEHAGKASPLRKEKSAVTCVLKCA
jgi:hypothetical protein